MATKGKVASTSKRILGKSEFKNGELDSPSPLAQAPRCPECKSQKVWKDGLRYTKQGDIQRWLCRLCGYRFSEPNVKVNVSTQGLKRSNPEPNFLDTDITKRNFPVKERLDPLSFQRREDIASHISSKGTIIEKALNTFGDYNRERRVCETDGVLKNLVEVQSRIEKAAGATKKPTKADVKGKIIEYAWWLRKQGYALSTIEGRAWFLKRLTMQGADIFNPDSIKEVIARQETWNEDTKFLAVVAYTSFSQMMGIQFEPPRYRPTQKFPYIPTEEEIDSLIAACGKIVSTFLQLLKETGMRSGEAWKLKWIDMDMKNKTVRITPEKGSNPRILPISMKLKEMLNNLPKKSEKIFTCSSKKIMGTNFYVQRKRIARKLGNPRLLRITFHTLRHWKATVEYHKTKDILHVMKTLGHKAIQSTLIYIDLEKATFRSPEDDEYTVRVAETMDEACDLLEAGFEYVTDMNGTKIFRKRK